ncbi:MAG: GAF domain-containing protein [Chloroflexi bacterium]|nr:GAF domain-containing protein [Chloroflexota bacterium]
MSARTEPNLSRASRSLVTSLATAFVLLSVLPVLLVSGLLGYFDFQTQQEALYSQQQLIAAKAAKEVSGFIEHIFSALEASAQIGQVADREQRRLSLEKLLGFEDALREIVLVDEGGRKIAEASRRSAIASADLLKRAESDLLAQVSQEQRFISKVYIDETTSEPLVILAVPVKDVFGDFQGALLAEVNLKFMWDVVDRLQVGETGTAYVVDKQGNLIAFGDAARVLKGENLSQLEKVSEFTQGLKVDEEREVYVIGINDLAVLGTFVLLGSPDWAVIIEVPVAEAYQGVIYRTAILLGSFLVIAIFAAGIGIYASRYLTTPLLNLTQTATRLAAGEMGLQAAVEGPAEVVRLASAFNYMTVQLQELVGSLEEQVAARTRRLEVIAHLSERLNAILDLEALLQELVNQVKDKFGYYHTHVYLIDEARQNLIMTAGVGQAGAQMKAKEHRISLSTPTSLVARAARTGLVVSVDNVREAADWLPNPLLPDTHSEMAVPIILEGQVVGILDVQEDKIAGLGEIDANVLRSLAGQVAVAIRNARLFEEVETALAKAYAVQEQYTTHSWEKAKIMMSKGQYHYARPDALALDEMTLVEAKHKALAESQVAIAPINSHEIQNLKSIVAPINLRDKTIGTLQLHPTTFAQSWSEDDLAIVEAVVDQLAQTAENLRLFEETRERAGREQAIREITDRLRAAPNLQRLVEIATEELRKRLSATHAKLELGIEMEGNNGTS